ncbi:MAG: hypothetical protein MPW17_22670 (plasmid) [Candidatus Manganitrophus sp.]|nr:hypothetical protein [Candidatus Manganitrophus sp.]WDT73438.1 MAG: hypothetical protein MPW17_22670 [Candidatus Manganitrophus sp.]WDT77933.1 MAG: hypothetical protein MPW16_21295 [Candidatus Manganitrophus sp.]
MGDSPESDSIRAVNLRGVFVINRDAGRHAESFQIQGNSDSNKAGAIGNAVVSLFLGIYAWGVLWTPVGLRIPRECRNLLYVTMGGIEILSDRAPDKTKLFAAEFLIFR